MRIVERCPESSLAVYHVGLVAQATLDAQNDRFDWLADQAATNAIGWLTATRQNTLAWRNLAQSLVDIGNPDAAGRALRARLRADPDYELSTSISLALITRAVDAVSDDRARDTIETIKNLSTHRKLSQQQGLNALAYELYKVSQIFSIVGNEEGTDQILVEAIRILDEEGRVDPNYAMTLNNLSYMRIAANRHDEETIRFMEQAYQLRPTDSNILDSIGWLRYKQGIFEDQGDATDNKSGQRGALSLIGESLGKNRGENPEVMDHLADALWRVGRKEEAIDIWKQVRTIVDDPARRKRYVDRYRELQLRSWRIMVMDPEAMYLENEGVLRRQVI